MHNPQDFSTQIPFLTEKEVSIWLAVPRSTLQRWRDQGEGPPFHAMAPRTYRYLVTDIQAWLAATQQQG